MDRFEDSRPTADAGRDWASARRRFLQGAGAGTVVTVLRPQAAWAAMNGSSNLSHGCSVGGNSTDCQGEGLSAQFWTNNQDLWHPDYPSNLRFHSVFGGLPSGLDIFPGADLGSVVNGSAGLNCEVLNVLHPGSVDFCKQEGSASGLEEAIRNLAEESIASLQNAATAVPFEYTVGQVIDKFDTALRDGYVANGNGNIKAALNAIAGEFADLNTRSNPEGWAEKLSWT